MDRLEFLVRRFRQLVPQPLTGWDPVRARHLQCWLRDDVGPVLVNYVQRPRFRAQAAWPVQTLRPGAATNERALVDKMDSALVVHARALRQFAETPSFRKQLEAVPVETGVTAEEVLLGSGGPQVIHRDRSPINRLAIFLVQLEQIASRFWRDLVCLDDYFEPIGGWMPRKCSDRQAGEFVVAVNPELHQGGDFISRCLCQRVEVLLEIIRDFHRFGDIAHRLPGASTPKGWTALNQRQQELVHLAEELRRACMQGDEQPLRDACILLTQVAVALDPRADVGWLDLSKGIVQRGAVVMRQRLQSCHGELLERLAVSLGALQKLYTATDAQQSAIDEAIATGGLVVVLSSQQVYWEGSLLDLAWNRYAAIWRFLLALVKKGQRSAVVEERDLYDQSPAASTLATTFSRLKKLVPTTLWKHIMANRAPRGYRLDLERQHVHLFGEK